MMPSLEPHPMTPCEAAESAVAALGCGYDLADDLRLPACKRGTAGSRLVRLDDGPAGGDLILPGGAVVRDVPGCIKCDKGERTRFRSDALSFHEMAEQFNQDLSLSGKIPSGLFNAMFDFRGCWQKDASTTKSLSFDGWFITLYSVELERTHIVLHDHVKQDVPSSWDPAALAKFIEKYGTHIIIGVKMGAKDVIHIKQQYGSTLSRNEVQNLQERLADVSFSEDSDKSFLKDLKLAGKTERKPLTIWEYAPVLKTIRSPVILNDSIVCMHVRRGGVDSNQSHNDWLFTISEAPSVISMSFVPITSLLNGVQGSGFLSHAISLYLRYKPPMEELHHFLEFQLPRKWAPAFGDLPLSLQRKKQVFPSLQFKLMGPRLSINTIPVESGNRPVTGIRLYLEGNKNDRLAIHLQHLSELPGILQLSGDSSHDDPTSQSKDYYEPVRWNLLSHVCTAPVQCTGTRIDEFANIVTKAWLEVREVNLRKVLFLRLGFSAVSSAKTRNSQWGGPAGTSGKSGSLSALLNTRFSTCQLPPAEPSKVDMNSAVFPAGPREPKAPRMSSIVDISEMVRGPEEPPGYWVVTGAKLCVEGGKISLRVKYSLLTFVNEEDDTLGR